MKGLNAHISKHRRVLIAPEEGDQFLSPIVKSTTYGSTERSAYNKLLDGKSSTRGKKNIMDGSMLLECFQSKQLFCGVYPCKF